MLTQTILQPIVDYAVGGVSPSWPIPYKSDVAPDYSDLTSMTIGRDGSGGNPGPGDVVGRVTNKGTGGGFLTAPADNQRPVLRKWPVTGRRNLLTYTEDFSQVWDTTRVTVTPGYDGAGSLIAKDPIGGTFRYIGQDFTSLASTGENTARFRVKPVVGTQCTLLMSGDGASTIHVRAVFDTDALTATNTGSTNLTDAGIIENGDGTFDIWVTGDLPVISNCDVYFYPNVYNSTADGQFVVYKTQINAGGLSEFQTVTNENDITEAGVPSIYSPVYDGVDDGLTYTFPGGAGPADCSVFRAENTGAGWGIVEDVNQDYSGVSSVALSDIVGATPNGLYIAFTIVETSKLTTSLRRTIEQDLKRKAGIQ